VPALLRFGAIEEVARQLVVAIRKSVYLDSYLIADGSLHCEPPTLNLRLHVLKSNAATIG
jgi:hypothetical protein